MARARAAGLSLLALVRSRAARGAARDYDLAINFEPDIRSNLLLAASGAAWTAGYRSGGGGALLDLALDYDTRAHTDRQRAAAGAAVFGRPRRPSTPPTLRRAVRGARQRVAAARRCAVGPLDRRPRERRTCDQAVAAGALRRGRATAGRRLGATIVLTGARRRSAAGRHRQGRAAASQGARRRRARRPARRLPRSSSGSISSSPATPVRCIWPSLSAPRSSPSSVRRIRRATRLAVLSIASCASTFRAARATASGCRRRAASATRRTAWRRSASESVVAAALSRCWTSLAEPASCLCVSAE